MPQFPSAKVSELLRILQRKPLEYEIVRQKGSHRTLQSPNGYKQILFSGHQGGEVGPTLMKKILVDQIGLTEEQALRLLSEGKL